MPDAFRPERRVVNLPNQEENVEKLKKIASIQEMANEEKVPTPSNGGGGFEITGNVPEAFRKMTGASSMSGGIRQQKETSGIYSDNTARLKDLLARIGETSSKHSDALLP